MVTLGITLNMCDVVALMNNTRSSDKVLQQMYRCMTDGSQKKFGFVSIGMFTEKEYQLMWSL